MGVAVRMACLETLVGQLPSLDGTEGNAAQ
jgi:hypothetical protein